MASLNDFVQAPSGAPTAFSDAAMVPQYRLNETAPALQEDASIASTRALQQYSQRTIPQMQNTAAGQGNFGSTGVATQAKWAGQDLSNQQTDIARMLARNTANIGQQKVMATMGNMF